MIIRASTRLGLAALVVLITSAAAAPPEAERTPAEAAFERLKSLAGTWQTRVDGKQDDKHTGVATYTVTGGGQVVLEVMSGGMATAYHLDKGALVMTHYCGAGNQPRMRANAISHDGRHIAFQMFDITNHPNSKTSNYTSALDVRFKDDGTIDLAFKDTSGGVERPSQTFTLVKRVASSAGR